MALGGANARGGADSFVAVPASDLAGPRSRLVRQRIAIFGLVIVAAMIYLVVSGFSSAVASVVSPSQLLAPGAAPYGQTIRLQGQVVGADRLDNRTLTHIFHVADKHASVLVRYAGDLPGGFRSGVSVDAQGSYDGHSFTAVTLTAKCPTKYRAAAGP